MRDHTFLYLGTHPGWCQGKMDHPGSDEKQQKEKRWFSQEREKNLTITSLPKREDFKLVGIAQMARSNKTTHYTKHRPKHKKTQQISFVINEEWSLFKPENTQYDHISLKSYQKWGKKVYLGQSKAKPLPQKPLVWLWEDTRVHEGWGHKRKPSFIW